MDGTEVTVEELEATASEFGDALIDYLPALGAALLVLLVGWIAARVVRDLTVRFGNYINRLLDRTMRRGRWLKLRLSPTLLQLIGNALFWLVILVFLSIAADVARLDTFSAWLDRVIVYLPTLLAGALIILVGYFISALVRDVVATALASAGIAQTAALGWLAQAAVFLTFLIVGIDQIGIDVTFLIILIATTLGVLLAGFALAFGLGARPLVENLIGTHYLRREIEAGETLRIGEIEGELLEIKPTGVVLASADGRAFVPGRRFTAEVTTVKTPADEGEASDG